MNDVSEQEQPEKLLVTSGQMLSARRAEKGITLDEISEALHLSTKLIEALESDQSEGLPEPTYVKGYISSYARYLGLEPERVLERYIPPEEAEEDWATNMPRGGKKRQFARKGGRVLTLFIAIAVLAGVSVLAYWYVNESPGIDAPGSPAEQDSDSATQPPLLEANEFSAPGATAPANGQVAEGSVESPEEKPDGAVRDAEMPSLVDGGQDPSPTIETEVALTFAFSDTSWVDVRDREDKRLMYKSYTTGDRETVSGFPPFRVFIGNASAVQMEYAGKPYDIMAHRNGMYAKFEIGGESM